MRYLIVGLIIVIILLVGLTFNDLSGSVISGRSVRTNELNSFGYDTPTSPYDSFYARAKTREFLDNEGYVDVHVTDMKQLPTDWFLQTEATKNDSSFILYLQVNKITGDVDWFNSGNEESSKFLVD